MNTIIEQKKIGNIDQLKYNWGEFYSSKPQLKSRITDRADNFMI